MKRIAVIGGGIFGVTAAIHAARAGHEVHLFEEKNGLLQAASGINQFRLHRGYHYPRSPETAQSSRTADAAFREEYGAAVIDEGRHLYAIVRKEIGSKISGAQYCRFCEENNLEYRIVTPGQLFNPDTVEMVIEGVEARFDPDVLRQLAEKKLRQSGARVHLSSSARRALRSQFDKIIVAAYTGTNRALQALGCSAANYQFEVCEKLVVKLPTSFGMTDIVVLDGDFISVDPFGHTGLYVLGHVSHAIHAFNIGFDPVIPSALWPFMDSGVIRNPGQTKFKEFLESGSQFIPLLRHAEHIGSMFTVRTVLGDSEETDARPTMIEQLDDQIIRIFSGKIGTCVDCARTTLAFL